MTALEYFKLLSIQRKKKGDYSIMLQIQEIKNTISTLPYKDVLSSWIRVFLWTSD